MKTVVNVWTVRTKNAVSVYETRERAQEAARQLTSFGMEPSIIRHPIVLEYFDEQRPLPEQAQ